MKYFPAVFIDLTSEDQAVELRTYLKGLGANISIENSPKGIEDDLQQIINVCEYSFREQNESDSEGVLNAIVSMLVLIPPKNAENLVRTFSEKLSKVSLKHGHTSLRVLWLLFQSLDEECMMRYDVYIHLIQVAQKIDMVRSVFKGIKPLKELFESLKLTNEQMQRLLRLLHDAFAYCKQNDLAAKVMIELLSTYTDENASLAKEDAKKCIVTALADPNTFLLDPLLKLKPIRCLEGELVYTLLSIFISEKLITYTNFYKANKDFVISLGLDHNQNNKKMRLLTFMQLAEMSNEIAFETIQKELNIGENEVEVFIIEALKTKLVRVRIDQTTKKVHVSSTMHRTFGLAQWQQLRDVLQTWKVNLNTVEETMSNLSKGKQRLAFRPPTVPAV